MVNPDTPKPDAKAEPKPEKPRKEQEYRISQFQEKFRRGLFWCVEYWRELFNFSFDKYMIIQVLPGVYGMLLFALVLTILFWCGVAFMQNIWLGIFAILVPAPIAFLVCASLLRALLEFYMVVFKISEHVDELVGLRDTVDRLSGISDTVDEMVSVTRRIPFWRAISGRPRTSTRQRVPENKRRRSDDSSKKDNDE